MNIGGINTLACIYGLDEVKGDATGVTGITKAPAVASTAIK